jgi:MFS family permease
MINLRALRQKTAFKATAPSILLVINSFVWYIFTYAVYSPIVSELETEKLVLFTTYYVSVAVSAILGAKFLTRTRAKSLSLWPFIGAIATFLLITVPGNSILANALLALFLGASIGIGLPSCLSYFAESTTAENRGFVGGIIWSIMGFTVLIFAFLISTLGQWEIIAALTIWRLLGGAGFLVLKSKHVKSAEQKAPSYLQLIRKRQLLLYLFPWILFSIINFAEQPVLENVFGADFFAFVQIAEWALIGVFAIVGGVIADIAGRKRVVIIGFIMLGIEYAVMSAFSYSSVALYLFLALDGTTWGLLFSVFFMALWGDLGENYEKEKYYALGGLPYLLSGFLYILIKPYASGIPTVAAFSFASFFLFLAVIPLMYAPETLPERILKDRDLKSYLEKAQKLVQKETGKNKKQDIEKTKKENEEANEETQESPEDEEARKLAEKYY